MFKRTSPVISAHCTSCSAHQSAAAAGTRAPALLSPGGGESCPAGLGGVAQGWGRGRTAWPPPVSAGLSLSPRPGEELHVVEVTSCPRAALQAPLLGKHPETLQELVLC